MAEPAKSTRFLTFAAVLVVVGALYLARDVLIPFALAALLSFLLSPLTARVEPLIGRVAGVVTVVLLACGAVGGVTYLVAGQLTELAQTLPAYRQNIVAKLGAVRGGALEKATEAVKQIEEEIQAQNATKKEQEKKEQAAREKEEERRRANDGSLASQSVPSPPPTSTKKSSVDEAPPVQVQLVEPEPTSIELIAGAFGPLLGPLGTGGMVIVLVLFMLLARDDLRNRLVRLMGRGKIQVTTQAMDEAGARVSRYLFMQTLINGTHGVAVTAGMFFLDVPNAMLWGLLSMLLRFVPYVGPWIAASMPLLVSFAIFDNWTQPLMVAGYFVVLELLSNNALEPWLYGNSAGVSPLAVIVTSIFWTWLWGPIGLLLATPLTVCMVVMGKHVPQLAFINILLGDEPVLEPHARFYQRLVAMDQEEAAEVAEEFLDECGSLVDVYDRLVLPALGLAEMNRLTEALDERRRQFLHTALLELIDDLGEIAAQRAIDNRCGNGSNGGGDKDRSNKSAAKTGTAVNREAFLSPQTTLPELPAELTVLALPARDEADELVSVMLAQLVRACGGRCEVPAAAVLTSGMVDIMQRSEADVVCISALPPSASVRARHRYKRLVARFPEVGIVVGLWRAPGSLDKARTRIGCGAKTPIVTTLRAAIQEIDTMARTRPTRAAAS